MHPLLKLYCKQCCLHLQNGARFQLVWFSKKNSLFMKSVLQKSQFGAACEIRRIQGPWETKLRTFLGISENHMGDQWKRHGGLHLLAKDSSSTHHHEVNLLNKISWVKLHVCFLRDNSLSGKPRQWNACQIYQALSSYVQKRTLRFSKWLNQMAQAQSGR